jgi:hypothetical protein
VPEIPRAPVEVLKEEDRKMADRKIGPNLRPNSFSRAPTGKKIGGQKDKAKGELFWSYLFAPHLFASSEDKRLMPDRRFLPFPSPWLTSLCIFLPSRRWIRQWCEWHAPMEVAVAGG